MGKDSKKIFSYWKYQVIGWFFYALIFCGIDAYKQNLPLNKTFPYVIIGIFLISLIGMFLSQQMRNLIKYLRVLRKPVKRQVIYLLTLTAVFTLLLWLLFNFVINGPGIVGVIRRILGPDSTYLRGFLSQYLYFSVAFLVWNLVYFIFHYIQKSKEEEQQKFKKEKELIELEARSLRAQMNPHFIFNCLNSIKSLIQQHEEERSVNYLTTFSKLIRTLFNNADKKEISLHDEIETCKLYLQLESMRFDAKFSYSVIIGDDVDAKSVTIPALIIQPFIENAIWHGIVPRNSGGHITLKVTRDHRDIRIVLEDDGIGRAESQRNKSTSGLAHKSSGISLTQSRLKLDSILQHRQLRLEITDRVGETATVTGTKVIITISEEV